MSELDANGVENTLDRRRFIIVAGVAAAVCACGAADATAQPGPGGGRGNSPPMPAAGPVEIGTLDDYKKDGAEMKFAKTKALIVIRSDGKLYASSSRCTHKGCVIGVNGADGFKCPCHGAQFSIQGTATKGPARDSLKRFAITKKDDGKLVVDTSKSFTEKQWDDAAASVSTT